MKRFIIAVLLLAGAAVQAAPPDADIRKLLTDRLQGKDPGVGIVVGVIEPTGRRVVAVPSSMNGDTLFEIGSITKVFTSLLLADAVQRGEVALTDPVAKYLPPDVKVPEHRGRKITLQDLATHTSGLPSVPSNLAPKNAANPYADYTTKQLYDFLGTYELTRDIGSKYDYSNLGAALLGHALARRAGMDYETLVRKRILEPLAMKSTAITLSDALKKRMAPGYDAAGKPASNWDLPAFAGAGALRSSTNDLFNFLAANLGSTKTSLAPAMAAQLVPRRPSGIPGVEVALGWHVITQPDGQEIVWHNGGTGGYRTFIAFDPKAKVGVVVLSNQNVSVDDLGLNLFAKPRKEIAVAENVLETYVGRYAIVPEFVVTITRDGNRLFAQATGQPKFEVFAETERDFFLKVVDAQLTFQKDESGKVNAVVLHQNGKDQTAKRVE